MAQINGKVALVTGGGGVIGRGVCIALAKAGAKVAISGRNLNLIEETVRIIRDAGGEAIPVKLDVTSEDDWQSAIDFTLTHFNKLNILVNNAGGSLGVYGCESVSLAEWDNVLGSNLNGTFLGIRAGITAMKENKESNSIINISSVSGQMPDLRVPYSVAKAGVLMLGKCSAMECRKKRYDNIRINTILPGGVIGEMDAEPIISDEFRKFYPPTKLGRPEDIAKGVLFLASEDSGHMTGGELVIDDGYAAGIGGFTTAYINGQ